MIGLRKSIVLIKTLSPVINCSKCVVHYIGIFSPRRFLFRFFVTKCPTEITPRKNIQIADQTEVTLKKGMISNPTKVHLNVLESFANELLEKLNVQGIKAKDANLIKKNLDVVINQLYSRKTDKLLTLFERLKAHNALSEIAYVQLIRYYGDKNDMKNAKKILKMMEEKSGGINIYCRPYVPLIIDSLRCGEYQESSELLVDLVRAMGPNYNASHFHLLIKNCIEFRTTCDHDALSRFVEEVFNVIGVYEFDEYSKRLAETICLWFQRDPKQKWLVQAASMEQGMCHSCEKHLQQKTISPHRLMDLKERLLSCINTGIIVKNDVKSPYYGNTSGLGGLMDQLKTPRSKKDISHRSYFNDIDDLSSRSVSNTSTQVATAEPRVDLENLKNHLDKFGPFDVVIDGLNCTYIENFLGRGLFKPKRLKYIANFFIMQKKRILVVCGGQLTEECMNETALDEKQGAIQKCLRYLDERCSLYFAGSTYFDDYHVLYPVIYHNFNVKLVSRDLYGDHLSKLSTDNIADFLFWQKSNQYFMIMDQTFREGVAIFRPFPVWPVAMQKHNGGWHVPFSREDCYCISKVS